jgi:hypothetical protein
LIRAEGPEAGTVLGVLCGAQAPPSHDTIEFHLLRLNFVLLANYNCGEAVLFPNGLLEEVSGSAL